jgi:integrase
MKLMKGISQRGKSYQAKFRREGLAPRNGTFPTYEEAVAFIVRYAAEKLTVNEVPTAATTPKPTGKTTIQELFERVNRELWAGNPDCKSEGQSLNARRFIKWVGADTPVVDALTRAKIAEFVEHRENEHENSGATINRYMAAVSALSTRALDDGILMAKPKLPRRAEGGFRMRTYTKAEEEEILAVTREMGRHDLADWFIFLCDTGARPKEVNLLKWRDCRDGLIYLDGPTTKNGTPRDLQATDRVLAVLERMRVKHGHLHGPFAWITSQDGVATAIWNKLRQRITWMDAECIMYAYRHTCASRMVQRGVDLFRVQIWLGHSDPKMTQKYAKFEP